EPGLAQDQDKNSGGRRDEVKRRNRANHTPHARLFVDARPPGHVSFTYKELTESLRRKSRRLCATFCREQLQQSLDTGTTPGSCDRLGKSWTVIWCLRSGWTWRSLSTGRLGQLGNNHTVDVSVAEAGVNVVMLELYSNTKIGDRAYGL